MNLSREQIGAIVAAEHLVLLGVVPLAYPGEGERFARWLDSGRQAGMAYLTKYRELRNDPSQLLPGARCAIVVGLPYSDGDKFPIEGPPRVAQYGRLVDYHKLFREKGGRIADEMLRRSGATGHVARVLVDSAPLLERALAARTRVGFIGKNTCYIHPEHGSLLLLGEILTSLPLTTDVPAAIDPAKHLPDGGCGKCDRCQVHCPTGALNEAYSIDSNLCLAYWTIEHRGVIPLKFWPWLKHYYYGCDICQTVCPYNKNATENRLPAGIPKRSYPPLFEVATMDQAAYEKYFGGTALTRAKRNGLRRNALVAMAVTGDPRLGEAVELVGRDADETLLETIGLIELHFAPDKDKK